MVVETAGQKVGFRLETVCGPIFPFFLLLYLIAWSSPSGKPLRAGLLSFRLGWTRSAALMEGAVCSFCVCQLACNILYIGRLAEAREAHRAVPSIRVSIVGRAGLDGTPDQHDAGQTMDTVGCPSGGPFLPSECRTMVVLHTTEQV